MKKLVFIVSLLVIATIGYSQTETKKPEVVFDSLTYNYGVIAKGSPGECSFKFTNKSKTPLILTNVKAGCGCTVPSWPREEIKPKHSGEIKIKYNTNNVGYFTKTISVYTNKQEEPIILTITGQVVDEQPKTE
ncbi:MAG TPA: DUF1573 domain-containing protein [Bacteroidales bacterium]|jgi:hypothetical protein|nr:DUF1573 domain-containing protein [Bacteroidales bacterium]HRS18267.1 DUF1573 domain-containing protein [Bacteroidales bacterium]